MQTRVEPHVEAVNELTAQWCRRAGEGDFVLSGAGVWPLLALLAARADEPARSELADAIQVSADQAHDAALLMLQTLDTSTDVSAALGLWVHRQLPLNQNWLASLPPGTVDLLTGQDALDSWANEHTRGLIERFPLTVSPDTLLVLATALVAKTRWAVPFHPAYLEPESGPWQGPRGGGLYRTTHHLGDVSLLHGPEPVTRMVVTGTADLDVHLLLGTGTPGSVLGTGLAALSGQVRAQTPPPVGATGPGLQVTEIESPAPADVVWIVLPPFEVRSKHNLLTLPDVFGLTTAIDRGIGHFSGISAEPLAIEQAAQDVLARFTPEGFETAAVSAVAVTLAGLPSPEHTVTKITARFDRPFGFLAVHRPTGLAVTAGWIASLAPFQPSTEEDEWI